MDREGVPTEQLMTPEIITVQSDAPAQEAVEKLLENDINSLVVVDDQDMMTGVITSKDFLNILSEDDQAANATVGDFMTNQVVTIGPDDSIQTAAARMITNGISHLPVEDEDGIVGMLSTTDITAYSVSRA